MQQFICHTPGLSLNTGSIIMKSYLAKVQLSRVSHTVSYHGKCSVQNESMSEKTRKFVQVYLSNFAEILQVRAGFHCGSAAPLLRGTWLHAAEQRGSTVTRHSRYRGRGPHFLMMFTCLRARARAKSNKSSCSGLRKELKVEF